MHTLAFSKLYKPCSCLLSTITRVCWCTCTNDCSISAILLVWSSQLEADWVKMNSTRGRHEGKLEKRLFVVAAGGERRRKWDTNETKEQQRKQTHSAWWKKEINWTTCKESSFFFVAVALSISLIAEWIILWEWQWMISESVSSPFCDRKNSSTHGVKSLMGAIITTPTSPR